MTVLDGIARLLAAGGAGLTYRDDGTPYSGSETGISLVAVPDGPDRLVTLTVYPGPAMSDRNPWRMPRLQVRCRGTSDPRDGMALDQQVTDLLHAIGPLTLPDGTKLTDCYSLQDGPQSLGQDQQGRWEYSRNYQLTLT